MGGEVVWGGSQGVFSRCFEIMTLASSPSVILKFHPPSCGRPGHRLSPLTAENTFSCPRSITRLRVGRRTGGLGPRVGPLINRLYRVSRHAWYLRPILRTSKIVKSPHHQ